MEEEDICAIFDDAWLGSRVWEAKTTFCDRLCGAGGAPPLLPRIVGSSVLELGAGTGIGGMVSAALGAVTNTIHAITSPARPILVDTRHQVQTKSRCVQCFLLQ